MAAVSRVTSLPYHRLCTKAQFSLINRRTPIFCCPHTVSTPQAWELPGWATSSAHTEEHCIGNAGEGKNQLLVIPASTFPEVTFHFKPFATVVSVACNVGNWMCPGKNCSVWPTSLKASENVCWTHNRIQKKNPVPCYTHPSSPQQTFILGKVQNKNNTQTSTTCRTSWITN